MELISGLLAFNFIVLIHELGHFVAAKLAGIKVLEFSIFIGPKIFSITRGDTTYSLRLLPLLAYVKMEGEDEKSESATSYSKKPLAVRAAVIAAGPFMNLFIATVILSVVFSITGFNTTRVDEVGEDSPAAVAGIEPGDRIVSYNGMRVYQPADLIQFIYVEEGAPAVIGIERNGKKMKLNFVPEIIPEKEVYRFGFSARSAEGPDSNVIALVSPGTPAEKSGLMPGDRIVKLNDTEIREKRDIDSFMLENRGKPVKMVLERNGSRITVDITPAAVKIPRQYYVGMSFEFDSGSVLRAIRHSMVFTWSTIKNVGYTVVWFAKGKVSLKNLVGPIGMVDTIVDVVEQGVNNIDKIIRLLNITAFLSVALGATNLIPIPALDGNKLLLIAIEAIRRKPIPPEKEAFINMIGFVMLLAILIFTLYNDTIRLIFG